MRVLLKYMWLVTRKYNKDPKNVKEFFDNRHDQCFSNISRKKLGSLFIPDEAYVKFKKDNRRYGGHNLFFYRENRNLLLFGSPEEEQFNHHLTKPCIT